MSTLLARSLPRAEPRLTAALAASAVLVFAGAWTLLHHGFFARGELVDTPVYQEYGRRMAHGQVPYRDFAVEYPPGALPAFVLPALGDAGRSAHEYRRRFEALMFVCGCALLAAVAIALAGLGARPRRMAAALAFAALAPLALGPVVLTRYDLLPAALTVAALAALLRERPRLAAGLLAAGAATKLYPAALLPLLLAWVWRRHGPRAAAFCGAVFAGVVAAVVLPFAVLSPGGLGSMLHAQVERPLQIESLGAAALVAAHHTAGLGLEMQSTFGSQNLAGALPDAVGAAQSALLAAALVALWAWLARRTRDADDLVRAAATALCAVVALGKVLSPQFLIWLVPLVVLVRGRRGIVAGFLLGTALVLTQLWFPDRYWDYALAFAPLPSWAVLARDLVLLALLAALVWPERAPSNTVLQARGHTSTGTRSGSHA